MSLCIKFLRVGKKKEGSFRIVVKGYGRRDVLECIGYYNSVPSDFRLSRSGVFYIKGSRLDFWLSRGAKVYNSKLIKYFSYLRTKQYAVI